MARPKKQIDSDLVEKLAERHNTIEDIAFICGVSRDTIERRFAALIAKKRAEGRDNLRKLQWATAEKGNPAMQIWLGKQLLDQSEKIEKPTDDENQTKDEVIYVSEWAGSGNPGNRSAPG